MSFGKNEERLFSKDEPLTSWETFAPTLHSKSFKTKLADTFAYYVTVHSVQRNPTKWNCTLEQMTDGDQQTRDFEYPPGNDADSRAFWANLKLRQADKTDSCKKDAQRAYEDVQKEINLLLGLTAVSSRRRHPPRDGERFQATIACFNTAWWSWTKIDAACLQLERPEDGMKEYVVTGTIVTATPSTVSFTLDDHFAGTTYETANNPQFLIWQTYRPLLHQTSLRPSVVFRASLSCTPRTSSLSIVYKGLTYADPACFAKDQQKKTVSVPVLGHVKEIVDDKVKFSLFLEDSGKQLYNGRLITSEPLFSLSRDDPFWQHDFSAENEMAQVGASRFTLQDAGGDGNCFYFALHDALKAANLPPPLPVAGSNSKEEFSTKMRAFVSKKITSLAPFLTQYDEFDKNTQTIVKNGLSEEFQQILVEEEGGDRATKMREAIAKDKVFVSQLEVEFVQQWLLKTGGIHLEIKNNRLADVHLFPIPSRIVLVNVDENHYKWYGLQSTRGGTRSSRRRRGKGRCASRRR